MTILALPQEQVERAEAELGDPTYLYWDRVGDPTITVSKNTAPLLAMKGAPVHCVG